LLERVGQRDMAAFVEVYRRYARAVYSLALSILRDGMAAEEVTQDVFLKVWRQPELYRPERGKFAAWLLTVARHHSIDRLRKERRSFAVPAGDDLAQRLRTDEDEGPDDIAWLHAMRQAVLSALASLPPPQQEVVRLACFHGLTQAEIAAHLQQPLGTIKTRMRLALRRLRLFLESQGMEM